MVNTNGIDFVNKPDDFEDLLQAHPCRTGRARSYYAPIERESRDMSEEPDGGRRARAARQDHRPADRRAEAPGEPIAVVTAYDFPTARLADEAASRSCWSATASARWCWATRARCRSRWRTCSTTRAR